MNTKAKILAIDDNRANILLLRKMLEGYYDVTTVMSGQEAISIINEEKFDLILLDIMMPEIDGFKVLEHLTSHSIKVPVIMVSACHEKRYINMAKEKGAVDYISKPFNKKELLEKVNNVLDGRTGTFMIPEEESLEKQKENNGSWFEKYFSSALRSFKKKKTILIADDSISDVMLLEYALEEKGYRVLTAYDGKKALEMIVGERPDLVILDIIMPGMDGIQVLGEIRAKESIKTMPAIIVSVFHEHQYIQRTMALGIEAYFTKPYNLAKLVEVIENVLCDKNTEKKIYSTMHFFA